MKTIGTRAEVMHRTAVRTSGGLRRQDLFYDYSTKPPRIRSVLASKVQKRNFDASKRAQEALKRNRFKRGQKPPPSKRPVDDSGSDEDPDVEDPSEDVEDQSEDENPFDLELPEIEDFEKDENTKRDLEDEESDEESDEEPDDESDEESNSPFSFLSKRRSTPREKVQPDDVFIPSFLQKYMN